MSQTKPADVVYNFIIGMIQEGQWPPHSKIWPENRLTDELRVSRVAVRDAIQKLTAMSVLRKIQGSGTYVEDVGINTLTMALMPVATISDEEFFSIIEFQLNFEVGNVHMFVTRCTDEEIAQLEASYQRMIDLQDSISDFYKADYEFHHTIAKGTGNLFVIRVSELCTNVLEAQHKRVCTILGPSVGLEDHRMILEHIKERDAPLAALYMQRHIQRIIDGVELHLKKRD